MTSSTPTRAEQGDPILARAPAEVERRAEFLRFVRESLRIREGEYLSATAIKGKGKGARLRNYTSTDHGECWAWLEGLNRAGSNCYLTTSPLREDPGPYRRGSDARCPDQRTLLVDCDPLESVDDARELHLRVAAALAGIPHTRVFSGRGHQVLVQLTAEAAELARAVVYSLRGLAEGLEAKVDKMTHDAGRLCRAPGFLHHGTGERAAVLEWPATSTTGEPGWDEYLAGLPPVEEAAPAKRAPRPRKAPVVPSATRRQLAPLRRIVEEAQHWPADPAERQALRLGLVGLLRRGGLTDSQILAVVVHDSTEAALRSTARRAERGQPYSGGPTVRRIAGADLLRRIATQLGTITGRISHGDWLRALSSRGLHTDRAAGAATGHRELSRVGGCGSMTSAAVARELCEGTAEPEQSDAYLRVLVCESAGCSSCWPRALQAAAELAAQTMPQHKLLVLDLEADTPHPCQVRSKWYKGLLRVCVPLVGGRWRVLYVAPASAERYLRPFAWGGVGTLSSLGPRQLVRLITEMRLTYHHEVAALGTQGGELLDRARGVHLVQNSHARTSDLHWPSRADVREHLRAQVEEAEEPAEISHHELRRTADGVVLDRGPHPYGLTGALVLAQRVALGLHVAPPAPVWSARFGERIRLRLRGSGYG